MFIRISVIIMSIWLTGCARVQSGKYVQLQSSQQLETLAEKLQVPLWQIHAANPGVEFSAGNWVFIPMPVGILGPRSGQVSKASSSTDEFIWPVPSVARISSGFGKRKGRDHHGIDIPASRGTPIVATSDGVVAYAGSDLKGYGKMIVISHASGMFSVYAHNKVNLVEAGQTVQKGEQIAQVGNSGRSTGPHLHFEIRYYNRPLDPLLVLRKTDYDYNQRGGSRLAMRDKN